MHLYSYLPRFYADRAVRLWPALLLCIAVIYIVWPLVNKSADNTLTTIYAFLAFFSLQNTVYAKKVGPFSPWSNTWSLAVEEQFYLVASFFMPLLLHPKVKRVSRLTIMLVVIASSLTASWYRWQHPGSFGGQDDQFFLGNVYKMCFGSLLRLVPFPRALLKWQLAYLGLAMLSCTYLTYSTKTFGMDPCAFADLYAALATVLVITGSIIDGNRLLELQVLQFLGRISYSFYLWQVPLLNMLGCFRDPVPATSVTCLAFIISVTSTLHLEEPIRHWYKLRRQSQDM